MTSSRALNLAFLTAFAISLFVLESAIPKPLPFFRLGLANVIVLLLITSGRPLDALIVGLCKSVIGGIITGTFLAPTTLMSLSGTLASWLAMTLLCGLPLGFIGLSVVGAVIHNLTQLIVVRQLVIRQSSIFTLTPWVILLGIGTGALCGVIAYRLHGRLRLIRTDERQEKL